ncbi:MAG: hypothetical protein R8K47_04790 [Mariprofundaceae bacterium]
MRGTWMAWMLALALGLSVAATPSGVLAAEQDTGFAKVQLMLKKLRDSMAGLKDLDELEKAGMPKKDVDRMRRVLKRKIQQMIDDTIISIQEI